MTTLQVATASAAELRDTREEQDARWNAWKSKGAAADQITQQRMRIAFIALLIVLVGVTIAMAL